MRKAAAHQSMVRRRFIKVVCASDGHDGFEMWRPFNGSFHLRTSEVADPDHADIAVRPRLLRGPLDQVVHVTTFLPVKETECATRSTSAPAVGNDVDIATRDEEIAGTGFNEACRRTKILNLPGIRRGGNQHRVPAGFGRTMHVRQQSDSITHGNRNVVLLCHGVSRLGQIAIFTASGLRAVESTLTGPYSGRWNVGHVLPRRRVGECRDTLRVTIKSSISPASDR